MADYRTDLDRFLADLDLKRIDADLDAQARRGADAVAVSKGIAIYVEHLGYSEEEALQIIKEMPRFKEYFAEKGS